MLTAAQFKAGKVDFATAIASGGSFFAVPERGSSKLREARNGLELSEACLKPPLPPNLLSPSSLVHLSTVPGRPFRLSERDGQCLFGQLEALKACARSLAVPL